jgi:stringent starvation protein A
MRKSVITLYSGPLDIYSHIVRIVLAEKGINVEIIDVDPASPPAELLEINPYNTYPTLVDRDLVLYKATIIAEYLEERFPYPPLLPVYPTARAKCRLMVDRIERDWIRLLPKMQSGSQEEVAETSKLLFDHLSTLTPVFAEMPYFLSEEFTIVDCCLAPLLWRLPGLGVQLPPRAKAVGDYAKRMFERNAFKASLSELEKEAGEAGGHLV